VVKREGEIDLANKKFTEEQRQQISTTGTVSAMLPIIVENQNMTVFAKRVKRLTALEEENRRLKQIAVDQVAG
jgi:formate dehydrogenase maturation protein FdhE